MKNNQDKKPSGNLHALIFSRKSWQKVLVAFSGCESVVHQLCNIGNKCSCVCPQWRNYWIQMNRQYFPSPSWMYHPKLTNQVLHHLIQPNEMKQLVVARFFSAVALASLCSLGIGFSCSHIEVQGKGSIWLGNIVLLLCCSFTRHQYT